MSSEADFTPLISVLLDFHETQEDYESFNASACEKYGENWASELPEWLKTHPQTQEITAKVQALLNYRGALLAWNEAYYYLQNKDKVSAEDVRNRIPVFDYWLSFFGEAGKDLLEKIKNQFSDDEGEEISFDTKEETPVAEKTEDETSEKSEEDTAEKSEDKPAVEPKKEEKLTPAEEKKLDEIHRMQRQKYFYEELIAWMNARCIHLGKVDNKAYPYYGFVADILKELIETVNDVLADESMYDFIDRVSDEKTEDLKKYQETLNAEMKEQEEAGFQPIITLDEDEVKRAKNLFGNLDKSTEKEFLGPAPDGFVEMDDPFENDKPAKPAVSKPQTPQQPMRMTPQQQAMQQQAMQQRMMQQRMMQQRAAQQRMMQQQAMQQAMQQRATGQQAVRPMQQQVRPVSAGQQPVRPMQQQGTVAEGSSGQSVLPTGKRE